MGIRFSVITVSLNDIYGLRKTYASLLAQTNTNFEWIVIDGGSSDGTVGYLEDCDLINMQWVSEKDKGVYDAMNRGVSKCTGEYVVFMNAGDTFYDKETLAIVEKDLSADGQATDILFGGAILNFPSSGRTVYRAPRIAKDSLWHGLPANHQATYYRKDLLMTTPYDLQYTICGDYYLAATLMRNNSYAKYLDKPLAIFEVGGQSYKSRWKLFVEPYRIQRDVLGMPLHYRLASVAKRFVSTAGFVILSQSISKK